MLEDRRMGRERRLGSRVWILVAIGSVAVAIGVALLLGNTIGLRNSADSTMHADAYLLRVVAVERLVVDAETGLRGYVITGRSLFLSPLRNAEAQMPGAVAALERSARLNHAYERQAQALAVAAQSYMTGYVPRTLALVARNRIAGASLAVTLAGKRQVDLIRGQAAELERLVSASQASRQLSAHTSAEDSIVEAIVVLVLLTGLTALLGGWLAHLALERDRARERSDRTTASLQQSILPAHVPDIPGCELAIRFRPAGAGAVGGDFYDVYETDGPSWAVVVGDVCGKGAEAAAISAMARWTLRSLAGARTPPADAVRFLNDAMLRQGVDRRFVTIAFLALTIHADHVEAEVACGGHPAPVLVPASGDPAAVAAQGDLLGVWPEVEMQPASLELRPGDGLVVYTDGVTDQGPGVERPPERALRDHPSGADAELLAGIVEELAGNPTGQQRDDVAILAVRFVGENQGGARPPALALSASSARTMRMVGV